MCKLIITIPGKPLTHGHHQREFKWSVPHDAFIYKGEVYDERQFMAIVEKVLRTHWDLNPSVRIVEFSDEVVAPVAQTITVQPVATITAREITAEDAIAALERLGHHRLKKKSGIKAA